MLTLEDYSLWEERGIDFSSKPQYKNEAVINFSVQENDEGIYFRKLQTLRAINKYVLKKSGKKELLKHYEDPMIKLDLYVPGMQPVRNIPIEVTGLFSYELNEINENENKNHKKNKEFDYIVIFDISQIAAKKMVSIESQVIFTNHTYLTIQIAHVIISPDNEGEDELTEEQILDAVQWSKHRRDTIDRNKLSEFERNFDYDNLDVFEEVSPNEEFRVPLKWFLKEVAIYYKTEFYNDVTYRLLLPNIKHAHRYRTRLHSEE